MTTKDIFYLVLSLSIAVFTVFAVWFLYYLIAIVRELRKTSRSIHEKVEELGGILHTIKDRMSDSVSALSLLTNVISKLVSNWQARRSKRTRTPPVDE